MNQENLSLGLFVGLIGSSIMATMFAVAYANAPVKGCDNVTRFDSPAVIEFCKGYTK